MEISRRCLGLTEAKAGEIYLPFGPRSHTNLSYLLNSLSMELYVVNSIIQLRA